MVKVILSAVWFLVLFCILDSSVLCDLYSNQHLRRPALIGSLASALSRFDRRFSDRSV